MRYKARSIALPDMTQVEVDRDIGVRAKTVPELECAPVFRAGAQRGGRRTPAFATLSSLLRTTT
jgi:hypothetical protein